jgi:hypothetical protein
MGHRVLDTKAAGQSAIRIRMRGVRLMELLATIKTSHPEDVKFENLCRFLTLYRNRHQSSDFAFILNLPVASPRHCAMVNSPAYETKSRRAEHANSRRRILAMG